MANVNFKKLGFNRMCRVFVDNPIVRCGRFSGHAISTARLLPRIRLSTIGLLVVVLSLSLVISCTDTEKRMKNQAGELLGIEIPDDVLALQYEKVFVTSEFTKPYFVYLQMEISQEGYLDLVQQLGVAWQPEKNSPILVVERLRPNRFSPEWWAPPDAIGDLSAAGEFKAAQNDGWVVTTYHNGFAYIKAFEEGTP